LVKNSAARFCMKHLVPTDYPIIQQMCHRGERLICEQMAGTNKGSPSPIRTAADGIPPATFRTWRRQCKGAEQFIPMAAPTWAPVEPIRAIRARSRNPSKEVVSISASNSCISLAESTEVLPLRTLCFGPRTHLPLVSKCKTRCFAPIAVWRAGPGSTGGRARPHGCLTPA
jgi:hypothetical protein